MQTIATKNFTNAEPKFFEYNIDDIEQIGFSFLINSIELSEADDNYDEVKIFCVSLLDSIEFDEYFGVKDGSVSAFQQLMLLDDMVRNQIITAKSFPFHSVTFSLKIGGEEYENCSICLGRKESAFGLKFEEFLELSSPNNQSCNSEISRLFAFIKERNLDLSFKNIIDNGSKFLENSINNTANIAMKKFYFSKQGREYFSNFAKSFITPKYAKNPKAEILLKMVEYERNKNERDGKVLENN